MDQDVHGLHLHSELLCHLVGAQKLAQDRPSLEMVRMKVTLTACPPQVSAARCRDAPVFRSGLGAL